MQTRSIFRLALTSTAIIALLVLSTGSAAASTGPVGGSFSQDGKSADGGGGSCTSNGNGTSACSETQLSIFVGKRSDSATKSTHVNQLCVNTYSYVVDDSTGDFVGDPVFESGCRDDLSSKAIRFAKNLASATLAPTSIAIGQEICTDKFDCEPGPSRHVTVAGTWTGFGPTTISKYSSFYDDGTCRFSESGRGSTRSATFTGTLDGVVMSGDYASINDGKSSFTSRCIGG